MKRLAHDTGTTLSNVYDIVKDASIITINHQLKETLELSSTTAFNKRCTYRKYSNNFKFNKAQPFIKMICDEIKFNKLSLIDETINCLRIHQSHRLIGLENVCTSTFYTSVHKLLLDIKPIDLPRMSSRRVKNHKTYIPKRQRGTSIDERPFSIEDRSIFGHWEGDLVVDPRNGDKDALLTLLERTTRFYCMIPIKKQIIQTSLYADEQVHKLFGDQFSQVFKSITFDNGSEFARYKDIEKKPGSKVKRTSVYFAHPYRSSERGSNENCNQLVQYFLKKDTHIEKHSKIQLQDINELINNKKRKILGYLPSAYHFLDKINQHASFTIDGIYL